jgi:hypothetical protein
MFPDASICHTTHLSGSSRGRHASSFHWISQHHGKAIESISYYCTARTYCRGKGMDLISIGV